MTARLGALPAVSSATSLASTPLGNRIIDVEASPTARKLVNLMGGYTLGTDRRTAAVVCVLEPPAAPSSVPPARATSRADAIDEIRGCMQEFPAGTVAGEPVMLRDGFAMLKRDGNLLGTTAGLLA